MKVVYILNIFPKISETFILNEIIEVQNNGLAVDVFSFTKANESFVHPKVNDVRNVNYLLPSNRTFGALRDHLFWFVKNPYRYLRTLLVAVDRSNGIFELFFFNLHNLRTIVLAKPDVIHSHFGVRPSDMAMLANLLTGLPFTFTTHGFDVFYHPPKNYRLKSQLSLKHITISQFNKNYLVDRFNIPEECVDVIHCGIDLGVLSSGPIPRVKNQFICVARLVKEKALENLIAACGVLSQRLDFQCFIVGDGPLRDELNDQINSLSLTGKVHLIGYKPHDEILNFLRQSSVMVLASRSEGIPVSLMEAMALGTFVVATKINGVPELIEDGVDGYLVEVDNVSQLVDRIEKILNGDPGCADFPIRAYEKISREFNLKTEVRKLINLWRISTTC